MKRQWLSSKAAISSPLSGRGFLLIVFCLSFSAAPLHAAGLIDMLSDEVGAIFEKAAPAVVKVRSSGKVVPLAGSGFFIDSQGTILTSSAVVGDNLTAKVEYQKGDEQKSVDALVIGRDSRSGVALLKIEASKTPYLRFGDSDKLRTATGLVSVAYPYNLPVAPNFGQVAGFDVQYLNRFFATTHVRANISVSPGQIGGPLLNSKGKVVALMVMAVDDGKACYGLPIKAAGKIISDIKEYGEARHGWVGVGVVEKDHIVRVAHLFEGTPAIMSGIEPGDHVLKIGDRPITQPKDILDAAFFAGIGQTLPVEIQRDGQTFTFEIEVKERPSRSRAVTPMPAPLRQGPRAMTVKGQQGP